MIPSLRDLISNSHNVEALVRWAREFSRNSLDPNHNFNHREAALLSDFEIVLNRLRKINKPAAATRLVQEHKLRQQLKLSEDMLDRAVDVFYSRLSDEDVDEIDDEAIRSVPMVSDSMRERFGLD